MNTEPVVDDRIPAPRAHPARGHWMVDGLDILPHITFKIGIREQSVSVTAQHCVSDEFDVELSELVCLFHLLEKLHALHKSPSIVRVIEKVCVDDWMIMDAGASQGDRANTFGSQQCRVQSKSLSKEMVLKQVGPYGVVPVKDVLDAGTTVTPKVKCGLNNLQI